MTKELVDIRKNLTLKTEDAENRSNMGVVGNFIELSPNKEKISYKKEKKKLSKKPTKTE
jgi:hypothetical protein